jgi:hypothetical protein
VGMIRWLDVSVWAIKSGGSRTIRGMLGNYYNLDSDFSRLYRMDSARNIGKN